MKKFYKSSCLDIIKTKSKKYVNLIIYLNSLFKSINHPSNFLKNTDILYK